MKLEMTNFRAIAANLVAKGEVCDVAHADVSTQTETGTEIAPLIQQIGDTSIAEIDRLIAELQEAKSYLQSEGERIEREMVRYTNLTQMAFVSSGPLCKAKVKETTTPEHEEALVPKAAIPVGLPAHCEVGHGRP